MRRHTESGTVYRSRSWTTRWSFTDWKLAIGMFAPYIFFAAALFIWLLIA